MSSQAVDIFSMLNKAQNDYNQQQSSVAAFFQQASSNNGGASNGRANRSMPVPIGQPQSLEQVERFIRASPPSSHRELKAVPNELCCNLFLFLEENVLNIGQQNNLANSPLAQFFNSNNLSNISQRSAPPQNEARAPKQNGQKISAPPGFAAKSQPQKNLLSKETKLITPVMFAPSSTSEKKVPVTAEPLTKNQLLQALSYLIQNDDDFTMKIHEAYIKSFKKLAAS